MGFSGWDGPKEHKLRKPRVGFEKVKKYRKLKLYNFGEDYGNKPVKKKQVKHNPIIISESKTKIPLILVLVFIATIIISWWLLTYILV